MTELVALRERAKARAEERGVKLTYLPFIVKAVVAGPQEVPDPQRHARRGDAGDRAAQALPHRHRGGDGRRARSCRWCSDADQRSLFDIAARDRASSARRRKTGKATRDELTGSTFTISSLGKLGGVLATPIINFPEVAILGVHKIKQRRWCATGRS